MSRFNVLNKTFAQFPNLQLLFGFLFTLLGSQANILREADTCGFYKQIELGYADLMSLEPVDEKFRPLRLKDCVRAEV